MPSTKSGDSTTGPGFLSLPPELRNIIYEYAFADVEDSICVNLDGETSANRRQPKEHLNDNKSRVLSNTTDDSNSRLSLLLTCKQIYSESAPIAYSKMSMTITKPPLDLTSLSNAQKGRRTRFLGARATFRGGKLKLIKRLILPAQLSIDDLVFIVAVPLAPSVKVLRQINHIVIHPEEIYADAVDLLKEGASWLSAFTMPKTEKDLVETFPNLHTITAKRPCGEQSSKVVDGQIFAAESGMRMRWLKDWV